MHEQLEEILPAFELIEQDNEELKNRYAKPEGPMQWALGWSLTSFSFAARIASLQTSPYTQIAYWVHAPPSRADTQSQSAYQYST